MSSDKIITVNGYEYKIPMAQYKKHFILADIVASERFKDIDAYEISASKDKRVIDQGMTNIKFLLNINGKRLWKPIRDDNASINFVIEFIDKYIKDSWDLIINNVYLPGKEHSNSSIDLIFKMTTGEKGREAIEAFFKNMHRDLPLLVGGFVKTLYDRVWGCNLLDTRILEKFVDIRLNDDAVEYENYVNAPIKFIDAGLSGGKNDTTLACYQYLQYLCVYKGMVPEFLPKIENGFDYTPIYLYILSSDAFYQHGAFGTIVIKDIENMFEEFAVIENPNPSRTWKAIKRFY